jgi:predicted aspartyl protease
LIVVPTYLNQQGSYRFAVNTGASSTVIATELAQQMGLKTLAAEALTGAGGQISAASAQLHCLTVGTATLHHLTVAVSDFLSTLSTVIGSKLDGVIGYTVLKDFNVTIDYPNSVLRLDS